MSDHYDRLENRPSAARETALFRDLRHILTISKPRLPALRSQVKGIEVAGLRGRADLATIPIVRRPPPGGGEPAGDFLPAMRASDLRQAFMVDSPLAGEVVIAAEGHAKDWWGMGRALHAAGLRKGMLVLNCFSYDLVPHGHMVASGAIAIGAPVVPAGGADLAHKAEAVRRLRPRFFCGPAAQLKALLDRCADEGIEAGCLKGALVMDAMTAGLRHELALRGVAVRTAIASAEFGLIAYESDSPDALILNENFIAEILDENGKRPIAPGLQGELVLTRVSGDHPLLRHATGALTALVTQPATCGRTNMRLRPPQPRLGEWALDVADGPHLLAAHLREIAARHPKLGRMRLVTKRPRIEDALHLKVERGHDSVLAEPVAETLRLVARLRGTVEFVEPGTLGDEGAHDEPSLS